MTETASLEDETPTEPLEGPEDSSEGEPPKSWLTEEGGEAPPTPTSAKNVGAARLLARLVAFLHARLAAFTHYAGWRLDEEEREMWEEILGYALKDVDVKNLGIYVVAVMLLISETSKVGGYLAYRRTFVSSADVRAASMPPEGAV